MKYDKNNKLKVFTAFSGYDSQCLALKRLKEEYPTFDFECIGWSEIDKYACIAHDALFPEDKDKNYGDITLVDWEKVPDFDLFTYSYPCQDISNAGIQKGFSKGSGTRSSLLWECERAVEIKRPKYLLMENVKALVQKKFLPDFNKWLNLLDSYGYNSYWQVLNSKDFGIPQNRERVFCISILRTPDDPNPKYHFPTPFQLSSCLADVLDEDVDESFFLRDEMLSRFCEKSVENETDKDAKDKNGLPVGLEGCCTMDLEDCKVCTKHKEYADCYRQFCLMNKYGKTPFGQKYP